MVGKCINCGEMGDTSETCACQQTNHGSLANWTVSSLYEFPDAYIDALMTAIDKRREERKEATND